MFKNKNRNKIQIDNNIKILFEPKIFTTINNLQINKSFKNFNPKNNFISLFKIPKEIYENSIIETNNLILTFDSDLLLDIISINKLLNVQKLCLETFNYLIFLDKSFSWLDFKKKVSEIIFLKNKMKQINYNKININSLNFFLNRLAPMNQFPRLIPFSTGLNHILKFIKNQINIIGYLNQKKDKLNNIKFKNEVIKSNITNSLNKIIPSETESINSNILLNKSKKIFIKSNNITKSISSEFSLRKRKTNKNIFQNSNKTKLNVLTLNDYNAYADKIKSEKKNLEKLPLINNKTFEEMRKFFGMNKTNNKKFEIKNLNIIKKFQNSNKSNLLNIKNKK